MLRTLTPLTLGSALLTACDASSPTTTAERTVELAVVARVPGTVEDVLDDRILYNEDGRWKIRVVSTGATVLLPASLPQTRLFAFFGGLFPGGVVVSGLGSGDSIAGVRWVDGVLTQLGGPVFMVAGEYAAVRRKIVNLTTLATRDVGTGCDSPCVTIFKDLSPTGDAVGFHGTPTIGCCIYGDFYTDVRHFRWFRGAFTYLEPDGVNGEPVGAFAGNGFIIIHRLLMSSPWTYSLSVLVANTESTLVRTTGSTTHPLWDVSVAGGWTAWAVTGENGREIWSRAPDGTLRRAAADAGEGRVTAVGWDGRVVFQKAFDGVYYTTMPPYTAAPALLRAGQTARFVATDGGMFVLGSGVVYRMP